MAAQLLVLALVSKLEQALQPLVALGELGELLTQCTRHSTFGLQRLDARVLLRQRLVHLVNRLPHRLVLLRGDLVDALVAPKGAI